MELKSVSFALKNFAFILHNSSVKLFTNNKAVAFITDSERMLLLKLFYVLLLLMRVRLSVEWIPLTINQKADYHSKIVDYEDWYVSCAV